MKNRAKCKVCNSIIESIEMYDFVTCQCGEIGISGGDKIFSTMAKNYENFLRVDDEGNEIIVKVKEKESSQNEDNSKQDVRYNISNPTRHDMLSMLDEMIKSYEKMPQHALLAPLTGYDMLSVLLLFSSLFRCKEES